MTQNNQEALWNLVPPYSAPSGPDVHAKAKNKPFALLCSLEPARGPDYFPMERFRQRWGNFSTEAGDDFTGSSRFAGDASQDRANINSRTPQALHAPSLGASATRGMTSFDRGNMTPSQGSPLGRRAHVSPAPSWSSAPSRQDGGFSIFGGKAYATPANDNPRRQSSSTGRNVVPTPEYRGAGSGLPRFRTLAQQRNEEAEAREQGGSNSGMRGSRVRSDNRVSQAAGSASPVFNTPPPRPSSSNGTALENSVASPSPGSSNPVAASGRKRPRSPSERTSCSRTDTPREAPVARAPAGVGTLGSSDRSGRASSPVDPETGRVGDRTWNALKGRPGAGQRESRKVPAASRGKRAVPKPSSRSSRVNAQPPKSQPKATPQPLPKPPPPRKYSLDDFAGADEVCFNPGATSEGLSVFLERCTARGIVVLSILWADLTTSFSATTVKYCLPSQPCFRWNCACGRQPRAQQATAPLIGAIVYLPPDGEETPSPAPASDADDVGAGSLEAAFPEGETYLLPLGACDGEVDQAAEAGGYELPLYCETSYDERWGALAKLVAMPTRKIAFNAQVALMPLVSWNRRSSSASMPSGREGREGLALDVDDGPSRATVNSLFTTVSDPRVCAWMLHTGSTEKALEFEALCIAFLKADSGPMELAKVQTAKAGQSAMVTAVLHAEYCSKRALALAAKVSAELAGAKMLEACEQVEMPAIPVLASMEVSGVVFLPERVTRFSEALEKVLEGLRQSAVTAVGGMDFNLASPDQVADVLFRHLQLPAPPIKAGSLHASTSAEVLEGLLGKHPVVAPLVEFRSVHKYKTTYVDKLAEKALGAAPAISAVPPGQAGAVRLHAAWHQTSVRTGRLSCSRPNLQQIPKSTDALAAIAGVNVRDAFVASRSYTLMSADYSQIEMRVLADACGDASLAVLFSSVDGIRGDVYRRLAAQVFRKDEGSVNDHERTRAKIVCLGIIYGMGTPQVARKLDVTESQAQGLVRSFLRAFPKIESFLAATRRYARENGYVCTLTGRRRHLPQINNSQSAQLKAQAERQAVNSVIQGTAADIIKTAMVLVARQLQRWRSSLTDGSDCPRLIMQIHDELVLECPACAEDLERLKGLLVTCMEVEAPAMLGIKCPLAVNMLVGMSWGTMRKVVS